MGVLVLFRMAGLFAICVIIYALLEQKKKPSVGADL